MGDRWPMKIGREQRSSGDLGVHLTGGRGAGDMRLPVLGLAADSEAVRAEVARIAGLAGIGVHMVAAGRDSKADLRAAVLNMSEIRASVVRISAAFHPSYAPYFAEGRVELTLPDEAEDLLELMLAAGSTRRGTIVAVVGAHGGAGTSTVAAWLARHLSATMAVGLIDADPCSAGNDRLLGLSKAPGLRWADLHEESGILVPGRLRDSLPVLGRLAVLSADGRGGLRAAELGQGAVVALSQAVDVCVVDFSGEALLPGNLGSSMLAWADVAVLVTGCRTRGVSQAATALGAIPGGMDTVVVATGASGGAEAASMAAELDVDRVIPLRTLRNLQSDLDHGMRVGDRKRSATARDIANLARICGDAA